MVVAGPVESAYIKLLGLPFIRGVIDLNTVQIRQVKGAFLCNDYDGTPPIFIKYLMGLSGTLPRMLTLISALILGVGLASTPTK